MAFGAAKDILLIEMSSSHGAHCTCRHVGLQLGVRIPPLVKGVDTTGHVSGA